MKEEVIREPFIDTVPSDKIITEPVMILELDLSTCHTDVCQFSSKFSLLVKKSGILTSLAGYFDVFFDLDNKVSFSTGPHATKTHWQQTIFYLKNTVEVNEGIAVRLICLGSDSFGWFAGDQIEGKLTCRRTIKNVRGLAVTLEIGNDKYHYNFG